MNFTDIKLNTHFPVQFVMHQDFFAVFICVKLFYNVLPLNDHVNVLLICVKTTHVGHAFNPSELRKQR